MMPYLVTKLASARRGPDLLTEGDFAFCSTRHVRNAYDKWIYDISATPIHLFSVQSYHAAIDYHSREVRKGRLRRRLIKSWAMDPEPGGVTIAGPDPHALFLLTSCAESLIVRQGWPYNDAGSSLELEQLTGGTQARSTFESHVAASGGGLRETSLEGVNLGFCIQVVVDGSSLRQMPRKVTCALTIHVEKPSGIGAERKPWRKVVTIVALVDEVTSANGQSSADLVNDVQTVHLKRRAFCNSGATPTRQREPAERGQSQFGTVKSSPFSTAFKVGR
jgi:hypothetical protein